jgi:hypothetical protein
MHNIRYLIQSKFYFDMFIPIFSGHNPLPA